jgi:hypothetical protein
LPTFVFATRDHRGSSAVVVDGDVQRIVNHVDWSVSPIVTNMSANVRTWLCIGCRNARLVLRRVEDVTVTHSVRSVRMSSDPIGISIAISGASLCRLEVLLDAG